MKSIISVIMTAALIFSALTACGTSRTGRVEEARVTPSPAAAATQRPSATTAPNGTDRDRNDTVGGAIGDAARDAGDAVGDVIGGVGNAVGNAVEDVGDAARDAGDAMGDRTNGRVTDSDGILGNERGNDTSKR